MCVYDKTLTIAGKLTSFFLCWGYISNTHLYDKEEIKERVEMVEGIIDKR